LDITKKTFRSSAFLLKPLRPYAVHSAVALAFASSTAGCGHASADPARFSGRYGTGTVDPALVREVRNKPSAYVMLGRVAARCRADAGVRSIRDGWLADVDCSEELLAASLREKAASVGGDALVGRECTRDEYSCDDVWKSTLITCSAKVASSAGLRPSAGARRPMAYTATTVPAPQPVGSRAADASLPAPPTSTLEYGSPSQAFRVKVSFSPAGSNGQRAPREPDRVNELAVLPPSRVVMGDIAARCRGECERAAVRYAVRAAAARVGATDVVGIACVSTKHGFLCTGTAARPEADPETNFLAR
jgi:hypothetical protein